MLSTLAANELQFGRVHAWLRELCGYDELLVETDDTRTALRLLDRLLVAGEGTWPPPGAAAALSAPERDRVLAEVWLRTFGPRIVGSPRCAACAALFDTDLRLDHLSGVLWPAPPAASIELAGGYRLRVPTGADELAVAGLPRAEAVVRLIAVCSDGAVLPSDHGAPDVAAVTATLEREAPVLDLDLDARCPECGAANTVAFRMQSYLLRALAGERARLPEHLHILARAYGWSASEILRLPRATRITLVRLAEGALSPRRTA